MLSYTARVGRHRNIYIAVLAAATVFLLGQGEAKAVNLKTFDLQWTPQPGSVGSINGKITLDLDSVSLPFLGPSFPSWATDLSVVVSGTGSDDGTFVQSDFTEMLFFDSGITFDFSQDLIGQGGWGTFYGDFNLFSGSFPVPLGTNPFELSSSSNSFILSKFAPASVPGPLPLFGAGAAFGWSRRLRKRLASSATTLPQG